MRQSPQFWLGWGLAEWCFLGNLCTLPGPTFAGEPWCFALVVGPSEGADFAGGPAVCDEAAAATLEASGASARASRSRTAAGASALPTGVTPGVPGPGMVVGAAASGDVGAAASGDASPALPPR